MKISQMENKLIDMNNGNVKMKIEIDKETVIYAFYKDMINSFLNKHFQNMGDIPMKTKLDINDEMRNILENEFIKNKGK